MYLCFGHTDQHHGRIEDTEVNELTAMPCGSPPTKAASAATPVGKVPKTRRKRRGSSDCVKVIGPPIGSVCLAKRKLPFSVPPNGQSYCFS